MKASRGTCTGLGVSAEDIGKGYTGAADGSLKNSDAPEGVNVYLTTLTLRDAGNNLIADTPISGTDLGFGGTAAGYGKNGLRTSTGGALYLYLPTNNASVTYGGKLYAATVGAVHTNTFTFAGYQTSAAAENISGYAGQTVTLTTHVTDYDSNPVNEGDAEFTVNSVIAGTAAVTNGAASLSWTIPSDWAVGSYPILVGYSGTGNYIAGTGSGTLTVQTQSSGGHSGGGTSAAPVQTYKAEISVGGTTSVTLPVTVDTGSDNAAVNVGTQDGNIFSGGETTVITVPSVSGVSSYTLNIQSEYLSKSGEEGSIAFDTAIGSITLPEDMLAGVTEAEGKNVGITIGQGDKSGLSDEVKAAIGDRPLIRLTMTMDGKQTEWNNLDAPVSVSIPYTPTAEELVNPEGIVIWYIDGSGNAVSVPNGHYDPATGKVTFTATHFSDYAVACNIVSFSDVAAGAWYHKAVIFIAARGITTGTGSGNFSPDAKLRRGDFLVLLMNAYGVAPDTDLSDNFSDAGNTYYTGYLAAAKKLGITNGIGNNLFAPSKEITRQEMFTLLYNALEVIGSLPESDNGKPLTSFTDAEEIASWAAEAMELFAETGTIGGSTGKLSPTNTTTRAEMAQVLYNLNYNQ